MLRALGARVTLVAVAAGLTGGSLYLVSTALSSRTVEGTRFGQGGSSYAIVYSALQGGANGSTAAIYVARPEGVSQLTAAGEGNHSPSWSPDGTQVAFASDQEEAGILDIYVMNADGGAIHRVTTDPAIDTEPQWSPDGSRIVFARSDGSGHWELYTVNADGTDEIRLTNNSVSDESPHWSPDGNRIVFQRYVGSNLELFVIKADGSGETRLTNLPGDDRRPSWSPAGDKIAFVRDPGQEGNGDIYVINADGTGLTPLTTTASMEERPLWSSDGSAILFFRMGSSGWSAHAVSSRGGSERSPAMPLAFNQALHSGPPLGVDLLGTV